jgi:hypothetical protein
MLHQQMEDRRAYLQRRRQFQDLPVDKLNEAWAAVVIAASANVERACFEDLNDLSAELGLRGLEEPVHLVAHVVEHMTKQAARAAVEHHERIEQHIGAFVDEWKKPRN